MRELALRVFTVAANNSPLIAFHAENSVEARALCREKWLREDLRKATSAGRPVWDGRTPLALKLASSDEVRTFEQAAAATADTQIVAYLIPVDSVFR
jgi:hypothetical protein